MHSAEDLMPEEQISNDSGLLGKKLLTAGSVLVAVWLTMLTLIDAGKYIYLKREVRLLNARVSEKNKLLPVTGLNQLRRGEVHGK